MKEVVSLSPFTLIGLWDYTEGVRKVWEEGTDTKTWRCGQLQCFPIGLLRLTYVDLG